MNGFSSPQILFLNTWDEPERNYCAPLFTKLRERGYERYVEPCAGAFVMPTVAAEAGWPTSLMETSDVSLFSAVCGYVFMEKPFDDLEIRIDEELFVSSYDTVREQGADILYQQLLLRMEQKPERTYWQELVHDLRVRRDQHVQSIVSHLTKLDKRLHGVRFEPLDVWDHVRRVMDDPRTVISINPPTYKGGFEKFYDTGGRLTWKVPRYEMFDAGTDVYRLCDLMQGKAALLVCQQQQEPGKAAKSPVYARWLSPGQNVYINTNRPDEVTELMGGLKVALSKSIDIEKVNRPVIPVDYEFTPDSKIEFAAIGQGVATYYRDLWLHKLDFKGAGWYVGISVDGYFAGMFGYDGSTIMRPYQNKWLNALLLTFAVGAPSQRRLTRLMTMIALKKNVIASMLPPQVNVQVKQVITAELTKYPEAKGLRGLMTLASKTKDDKYGYRLIYRAEVDTTPLADAMERWLTKEIEWSRLQAART